MATVISTHKLFNALKESGFPESQANAVINTIESMQDARLEDVATKADLYKVEFEIKSDLRLLHWGGGFNSCCNCVALFKSFILMVQRFY